MIYCFLLGFLLGILITAITISLRVAGTLKVFLPYDMDQTPYLGLKVDKPLSTICKKDTVVFRVEIKNLDSQE